MTGPLQDVIVVGGGSTGLSAALPLGRLRARTLVLDGGDPRNGVAAHMHGVLGRDHTSPLDLLADGRRELERYGVPVIHDPVVTAARVDGAFALSTAGGAEHRARRVLVATGLGDALPTIEGIAERWGSRVVACPFCDGWEHRDESIGVLASTPEQRHQILLLRRLSDRVTVLTDGAEPFDPEHIAELEALGIRIDPRPIARIAGAGSTAVLADGDEVALDVLFVRTTPQPRDEVLLELGAPRDAGPAGAWVGVDEVGRTIVPGLWAAGNVVNPMHTVPAAMAAGALAGAALCGDLIADPGPA